MYNQVNINGKKYPVYRNQVVKYKPLCKVKAFPKINNIFYYN